MRFRYYIMGFKKYILFLIKKQIVLKSKTILNILKYFSTIKNRYSVLYIHFNLILTFNSIPILIPHMLIFI